MKFVDGLANVAGKYAPRATATKLVVPALVDPHDLLAEVLAVQQPQKSAGIRSIPSSTSSFGGS